MKALLIGYGKMGQLIHNLAHEYGITISGIVDRSYTKDPSIHTPLYHSLTDQALDECDIVIEFAHLDEILPRIEKVMKAKKPYIIGTTGWDTLHEKAQSIVLKEQGAVLVSSNFSIGVLLFLRVAQHAASLYSKFPQYDCSICEAHHKHKKDIPSGTALTLQRAIQEEYSSPSQQIPIASTRSGYYAGTHEISFDSPVDTITLSHTARSREGFARGALDAAKWLTSKQGWFGIDDLINDKLSIHASHKDT